MATIPGALSDQGLSSTTQALIDQFVFIDGQVTETSVTGGTIVVGQGGNQVGSGVLETQALFLNQGTSSPVTASIDDGQLTLTVTLPPGVDLGLTGPSQAINANQLHDYVNNLIGQALPEQTNDPYQAAYKQSLELATQLLSQLLDGQNIHIRIVSFADSSQSASSSITTAAESTGNTIVFDGGQTTDAEVLALRLDQVKDGTVVTLKNVTNALLVDSGSVVIEGSTAARVVGDITDQKITGGDGNYTLVGGGGNDTLVGGAGDDVIGFNAAGHYTIEGFDAAHDKLAFANIASITNLDQLNALITKVTETDGNVTYEFNNGEASITLVGVSADQITSDLVQFTL